MNEEQLIEAVEQRLVEGVRNKAAGTTPSSVSAHGPGGIFAQPGQRAAVVNAMVMPYGLADRLPRKKSVYANEVYPILTGQTAATGSNPSTACGDCKQPGNLKVCNQSWPFGRWCMDSQVIQVDNLGQLLNRSEFVDQTLLGNPFAQTPPLPGTTWNPQEAFRNEKAKQLFQMFVDWKRTFAPLWYTGNPVNNSGEGYKEPYGFDKILNTGYIDTYTGARCQAADPLVMSFGGLDVGSNGAAVVQALSEMLADRKHLADELGLAPVKYALSMRYALFRKLTEIWPCTYYSYRCSPGSGSTNMIDAESQVRMRDEMRKGSYLLIDGEEVEVVIDNTINETIPVGGTGQSDIYIVPLASPKFAWAENPGGLITYVEFFDMSKPVNIVQEGIGQYPANTFQTIGGGEFLVYPKAPSNVCIQYGMIARERLIVEAPFLGGRLTNLRYTWYQHEREWNPSSPYYFYNGGQYQFTAPYFYPPQ